MKQLYKSMMFPKNPNAPKFALSEIDNMDFGFFDELMGTDDYKEPEKMVYIDEIW